MFPDSRIAASYSQVKAKVRYNIQFGIAPYIKHMLLYDVNNIPSLSNFMNQLVPKLKSNMMDIFSIGLQNMMRLLIVTAGVCLLVIVPMCNWLNIIMNLPRTSRLILPFCCIWEWMDQVLIMHFSRKFFMSCKKRKVLVFWICELAVFTKFIMHNKQRWKNWNLTLISLLWTFTLFSNFQVQDKKTAWGLICININFSFSMNYRSCKR